MNPHVLFLTCDLSRPDEPGMARPWEELVLMRELGWEVTVITASAHYLTGEISHPVRGLWRRDREDGVTYLRTWSPTEYRRSSVRRLLNYLAYSLIAPLAGSIGRRADIVFSATDPPFMTPGAYLLARRHRARLVLDERDLFPDTAVALGLQPPSALVRVLGIWNEWLRRRAATVVTVSPGLVRLLAERGASVGKTAILENYFPAVATPPVNTPAAEPFVVLYAGGLGKATNIETCLGAAQLVQERGYDAIRFVFLGAGERRNEYIAAAAARGLHQVEFRASVPRDEMPRIFAQTHVTMHAFPSHPYWRCALSSKILEYLAHGKPVVFSGEGDIPEVLREADAGFTVPPDDATGMADAIIRLYESPALYRRMSTNAAAYMRARFNRAGVRERLRAALLGHEAVRHTVPASAAE